MSKGIPKCRTWRVRCPAIKKEWDLDTINKNMARVIMGMDHPETWRHKLVISLARSQACPAEHSSEARPTE